MNISFDFKEFKWIQAFLRTFDNKGTEIRIQKLQFSEDYLQEDRDCVKVLGSSVHRISSHTYSCCRLCQRGIYWHRSMLESVRR